MARDALPNSSEKTEMSILHSALTRKLSAFVALSDADMAILARFHQRRRRVLCGHEMIHEGQTNSVAFILAEGWACSYKMLPDGERQIVNFQIPGDFLGLLQDHGTGLGHWSILFSRLSRLSSRASQKAAILIVQSARGASPSGNAR